MTRSTTPPARAGDSPHAAAGARDLPLVIAHRGASCDAPENTIVAFELASAHGADAIHLDVQLSRDGRPVVIHDGTLERTTDGMGAVRDRTVRELKRLDAGAWRGRRFRGQRIQTLEEVLERFRDRLQFWVELPAGSDQYSDIEDRVVSLLEIYEVGERAVIQSLDHRALARIRAMERGVRLGGRIDRGPIDSVSAVEAGWHAVCPAAELVSGETMTALQGAGLACYACTVNEPAHMDRLVGIRVSGIITGRPDWLRERITRAASRA
jgi:glycerophosphoryl diester phosphodiesterase